MFVVGFKFVWEIIKTCFRYLWYCLAMMVDPDYVIAKEFDGKKKYDDRDD